VNGRFEEQKKRYVKQVYVKMSAKEKETLKWRMADIDKAGAGAKESTPPSPTPMNILSSNCFMLLLLSCLCNLIYLCGCQLQPNIGFKKLTMPWHLKIGLLLSTEGELHQTKTYTSCQWCVKGNGAREGGVQQQET
jgi:hypothetical protein